MNKIALIFAAAAFGFAGPVVAADAGVVNFPSAPDSADWTGFYVGGNAGYGWNQMSFRSVNSEDEIYGALAGVQAGYNWALGGVVLGVEADVQLANAKYYSSGTYPGPGIVGAYFGYGMDGFATVRARAGIPVDRFLPYVTAGVAVAHFNAYGGDSWSDGSSRAVEYNRFHVGWTVGAGVEMAVTDQISLKAEYLYADFGTANYAADIFPGGLDVRASTSVVRLGVNYKF